MKNLPFCIEKFSYITSEEQLDVSLIPPLTRRKLSLLDKASLTTMLKVFEFENIEEIVFSSEYGEFTRLNNLIKQYQELGETSPAAFSASVHNYPVSFFTMYNKLNLPYYALSAGKASLAAGLVKSIRKRTLFTYADTYDGVKSVSCIISPNQRGMEYSAGFYENENFEDFIEFLEGNKSEFLTEFGSFFCNNC